MPKISMVSRNVNGTAIEQRQTDGFINGTAMCTAHDKEISDWLKMADTWDLVVALADDLGIDPKSSKGENSVYTRVAISYPALVIVRQGAPSRGGGTWIHPDLAVQLAQWCSKRFAIQVSRWVLEWMTSALNPTQLETDTDRVTMRDDLKDAKRLALTGQVKRFLVDAGLYGNKKYTGAFFGRVHNELNTVLTTEKAETMRVRLEEHLGRKVSESELLRDYFPIVDLTNYAALCQAAANEVQMNNTPPIEAIRKAAKYVLPLDYIPKPIDFTERISLVRRRLHQRDQLLLIGK